VRLVRRVYSAIERPDGRVEFETHVPPGALAPREAGEAAAFLESVLRVLRERAGEPAGEGAAAAPLSAGRPGGGPRRRERVGDR
jgi:hypothetical protein